MKRAKDLYPQIINVDTLRVAARFAMLGKRERANVQRFIDNVDSKLLILHNLLLNHQYHPLPYTRKTIQDKCTNKVREIFVPKFYPDQIVQWALMLRIRPLIMRGMTASSCASIESRGATYGMRFVQKWLKNDRHNTKYCLVCDIRKFYPSIDQDILMQKFHRIIKDSATLDLIELIVRSVPSGVPIGNYTSQWFANFYLQDFDHYVYEKLHIPHYLRYMDDMVFFSGNKRTLHKQRKLILQFLQKEKLTIKPNWQIFRIAEYQGQGRPLDFLGYKFYRDYTTIRKRTYYRGCRRIKKATSKSYLTARDASAIIAYNARFKLASGAQIYRDRVAKFINIGKCRYTISHHDKLVALARKKAEAQLNAGQNIAPPTEVVTPNSTQSTKTPPSIK